jgi:nucleoside-diphosphate-sugar epimerase
MTKMNLHGRKVFVTGASGFIGGHLCRRLADAGAEVHGSSRHPPADSSPSFRWWQADLAEWATVRKLVTELRPDVIFHCAGAAVGLRDLDQVEPMLRGHLLSTVNVLLAATESGCRRVIIAGSLEEPVTGDLESPPSSPYAAAKFAATGYARMFRTLYGLEVAILRLFMVYGPGQRELWKLIPFVITSLLRGESPVMGSGQRLIDWVYVDDAVEAFIATAVADSCPTDILDVGSGTNITVRELVERLVPMVKPDARTEFVNGKDRPHEQVRVANPGPTRERLGWTARVSLDDGLRRTVEWYRSEFERGLLTSYRNKPSTELPSTSP